MYSAISSIPSGGPPGGTHTQELWYSLRGIDVGLQSVLSADKCPCGACCVRVSRYYFAPEYSTLYHQSLIFRRRCKFFGEKTHVAFFFFLLVTFSWFRIHLKKEKISTLAKKFISFRLVTCFVSSRA